MKTRKRLIKILNKEKNKEENVVEKSQDRIEVLKKIE